MSIIFEALEKAQKKSRPARTPKTKATKIRKMHPRSRLKYAPLILVILVGGAAAYFLSSSPHARAWFDTLKIAVIQNDRGVSENADDRVVKVNKVLSTERNPGPSSLGVLKRPEHMDVDEIVKLSGIMYTPEMPLAVINDAIWCEGESIEEFRIQEIGKDYLILDSGGKEHTIRLRRQ